MKRILTLVAALLVSISMMSSLVSCSGGDEDKSGTTSGGNTGTGGTKTTDTGLEIPDVELKNKEIKVMGIDQPQFREGGVVAEFFKKYYDGTITQMIVPSNDLYNALATEVSSGNSPDIVAQMGGFPSLILTDAIQDVEGVLYTDLPLFQEHKAVYDQFVYNEKHYYLPWVTDQLSFCFFNKKIFEDNELENPRELYLKGEWTWDKFSELAKALTINESGSADAERWGAVYTSWHEARFVYTTGEMFIKTDGKTVAPNFDSPNMERAFNFLTNLVLKEKVVSPNNDIAYVTEMFNTGKAAMLLGPDFWSGPDILEPLREGKRLDWAPYPKDPNADQYYVPANTIGYYMAQGAPNKEGVGVFIAAAMAAMEEQGLEGSEAYKKGQEDWLEDFEEYGYTLEDLKDQEEYSKNFESLILVGDPYRDILDPSLFYNEMIGIGSAQAIQTYQQARALLEPGVIAKLEEMGIQ